MRIPALIQLSVLLPVLSLAQSTNVSTVLYNNVKKADLFYDHFAYRNALEIYLHVNEKNNQNFRVRERIADCYFKLHDPVSAESWFSALAKEEALSTEGKFEYAEALSMNGRYEESKFWFSQYLKDKPSDSLAIDKLQFLNDLKFYTDKEGRFLIAPINNINTIHSDYGAHLFRRGIVFASSRDADQMIKHKPADGVNEDESLLNLFYAIPEIKEGGNEPKHFHQNRLKTAFHEGPMTFYDNYKKGAFTQSNVDNSKSVTDENGQVHLQIYFAEVGSLGELKNITPFEHNHDGYSNAHPSFSSDGKTMYFSSTRNMLYGASDIFYSEWENGHWTTPASVGKKINTREDESFPFLANDSTLFFSSNGHGTLGGLDMYVSYKRKGEFTRPINLGYPANTRYDDFSFVSDSTGRVGYIASNRPGGKGLDDIYQFVSNFYTLIGTVRELSTEQPVLPNTFIRVVNGNGDVMDTVTSNENGIFRLDLPFDQDYIITGKKEGYENLEGLKFSTKGKPYGVDSIMLPMWKHNLFAKGKIFNNESQSTLKGATVRLKNLTDGTQDSVVVDETGEYSFLTVPNHQYEIEVHKDGFIPSGFKLNTKDLYEGNLLNDIVLEEVYIEKDVILFDFNESVIKDEAKKQLIRIVRTLRKFPATTLNIGAHADSRGTVENNLTLSKRRADATVDYFISHGISKKRITAIGFGEELILNRCSDGVECPEEEHSMNRRAEIKIQK
jgi:outer membrane protein OmpA-like peptidoglycan-associated protein/tetratricopeptide (TPR) repeat protein